MDGNGLLQLQRQAGNQAAAMLVQRATAKEIATAERQADADFSAGRTADYFAGNFLANHIEAADEGVKRKGGKSVTEKKEARTQGFRKLEQRSNVAAGGTGWQGGQNVTGINSVILDYGPQKNWLMRELNKAQIDSLADPQHPYLHFTTSASFPVLTYDSKGTRAENKVGTADLGADYDAPKNRYQINHLAKIN